MSNLLNFPIEGEQVSADAAASSENYVHGKLAIVAANQGSMTVGVYGTGSVNPGQYTVSPNCTGTAELAASGVAYGASFYGVLDANNQITRMAIYSPTWPK
jgi:hypothetical protein